VLTCTLKSKSPVIFSNEKLHYPTPLQFQKLFDTSPDIICSLDIDGRFLFVSHAVQFVLGYLPQELIGRHYLDFVIEEDHYNSISESSKVKQAKDAVSTHFVNRYRHKDGHLVPLSWSSYWDYDEKLVFCIARDMTDHNKQLEIQARYEEKIKKQNQELHNIMERIADAFFATDNNWMITYVNKQVEKILNINREDYLYRNFWECFPGIIDTVYEEQYHKAKKENTPVHFEAFFPKLKSWFSVDAYPSESGLSIFFRDITETKRFEEENKEYKETLEKQNKQLTNVLERMNQGFFFMDSNYKIKYWNNEAEKSLRVSRENILGKDITSLYPPDALSFYQPMFEQAYSTQQPIHSEHVCPRNNRWTEVSIYPSNEGYSVFFKDINNKKYQDEELHRLSLVAKETVNSVVVTDLDYSIRWVNEAFTRMSGYTLADAVGKNGGSLTVGPQTNKNAIKYILHQRAKGLPYHVEVLNYKKNGELFWSEVYGQPVMDESGNVKEFFAIETDITERKKVEEELQKLSFVAQQTDNIVVISSVESKILWANAAFTRVTGYKLEEVLGKLISEVFDGPKTDPKVIEYAKQQFLLRKSFSLEAINYKKNGETYWADISCKPLYNAEGELQYFFSIAKDITDHKEMQQEIDREKLERQQMITAAAIQAQEKERTAVSQELHDNVNQVLTTVKLYTELCRDGIGDSKEIMDKSIKLLQETINEIRSLSKRLSAPSLGNIKLLDSIRDLVEAIIATNKIAICLKANDIEDLKIDQETHLAIYRILQEHFTNVLKHADAKQVHVVITLHGDELLIKITDDGKGFDKNQGSKGIGIANMETRATSVKGKLDIFSASGKGCILQVTIPILTSK
jgi:PAS domain S-box-containing protein